MPAQDKNLFHASMRSCAKCRVARSPVMGRLPKSSARDATRGWWVRDGRNTEGSDVPWQRIVNREGKISLPGRAARCNGCGWKRRGSPSMHVTELTCGVSAGLVQAR